jgi:hypothetical protein
MVLSIPVKKERLQFNTELKIEADSIEHQNEKNFLHNVTVDMVRNTGNVKLRRLKLEISLIFSA